MKRILTLGLLTAVAFLAACERGPSREQRAQDRYALELANCAAYFAVMADCLGSETDAEKANVAQTKVVALRAMRMATEMSTPDTVRTRVTRATDRINGKLENQCLNPEVIVEEYGETCAKAIDDPEGRAAYWLDAVD